MMSAKKTEIKKTVSASHNGKALIVGGYVILEGFNGISMALDSCCTVTCDGYTHESETCQIDCYSETFDEHWLYSVDNHDQTFICNSLNKSENKYLECCLQECLHYLIISNHYYYFNKIIINIYMNEGYYIYKQGKQCKSGIGSSSSLCVSLCHAFLQLHLSMYDNIVLNKRILLDIAYKAHGQAQGIAGSGFDIYTSIYGSCIFNTKLLNNNNTNAISHPSINLPPFFSLQLIHLYNSSSTSQMVKRMNNWKQYDYNQLLWKTYIDACAQYISLFESNSTDIQLYKAYSINIINILYSISKKSDIPVIPEQVKVYLDSLLSLDSIIAGGILGAGGYDAFYVFRNNQIMSESEFITFINNKYNDKLIVLPCKQMK
ncbi:hypothetical protein WA158_003641 [Blastocystis sp. Blastoise]